MEDVREVSIDGPAGRIEAAVRESDSPTAAAVVAHPHPSYGGTLHNPVVFHADRELNRAGLATLRFNFRGVGLSEGSHDDGRGEVDDLGSAVAWMRAANAGLPLLVVGYSFGSLCGLRFLARDRTPAGLVAIGLPVRIYSFEMVEQLTRPLAIVQGTMDEFGSPEEIGHLVRGIRAPTRLLVLDGADHYFSGQAPEVGSHVVDAAAWCLEQE